MIGMELYLILGRQYCDLLYVDCKIFDMQKYNISYAKIQKFLVHEFCKRLRYSNRAVVFL